MRVTAVSLVMIYQFHDLSLSSYHIGSCTVETSAVVDKREPTDTIASAGSKARESCV